MFGLDGNSASKRFLRFVIYVAIGGVAVGVAALIFAFSITRGFSSEIESKIVGFSSHIQIDNIDDTSITDYESKRNSIKSIENVVGVRAVVEEFVLIQSQTQVEGASIWGLERAPDFLKSYLTDGALQLKELQEGRKPIVISKTIADRIGVEIGSIVTIFSNRAGSGTGGLARPQIKQFYVGGIYDSGFADFDEIYLIADLEVSRELLGYSADEVSRFDVEVEDWDDVPQTVSLIEDQLGFPYWARSVKDIYGHIFAWVDLQKGIIPLVISIITIVASFNIIGTLLIAVLEKSGQIGILAAIGAGKGQIMKIFVGLGIGIGLIGTLLGEGFAFLMLFIQDKFKLLPLPADTYYMTTAPVEMSLFDFIWIGLLSIILCMLAAYIPARVASKSDPITSIRIGN